MRYPALVNILWLRDRHVALRQRSDGRWLPARHEGYPSLRNRIRLAWGVLTGRYDALDWRE